jgi:hypothetical protein
MSRLARGLVAVTALAFSATVIALPGGCSRRAASPPATVRGKVTYQGEPLVDGLIVFAPDPDRGGRGPIGQGEISADGTFQLMIAGANTIPPGWYRVAFAPAPQYAPGSVRDRAPFPLQLSRPDQSNVVREVKAGQENVFEFMIEIPGL